MFNRNYDPTGGVIPSATVTVTGVEAATTAMTIAPVVTSPQGVATVTGLAPGRYNIQAEFQGFETNILRDVRLGRNSARADGQWTLNGNFAYTIAFGRTAVRNPPGVQIIGTGGGAPTVTMYYSLPSPSERAFECNRA